jgi:hypothetical protein
MTTRSRRSSPRVSRRRPRTTASTRSLSARVTFASTQCPLRVCSERSATPRRSPSGSVLADSGAPHPNPLRAAAWSKGMGQSALWRAPYALGSAFLRSRPCKASMTGWRRPGLRQGSTWRDQRSAAAAAALLRHRGRGWEEEPEQQRRAAARSRKRRACCCWARRAAALLRPLDAPRHCVGLRLPTTTDPADRQSGTAMADSHAPIGKSAAKARRSNFRTLRGAEEEGMNTSRRRASPIPGFPNRPVYPLTCFL